MAAFLFWNLHGNRIENRVARLVVTHDIDVVMLAESANPSSELLSAIDLLGGGRFRLHGILESKVRVYSRMEEAALMIKYSDTLRRLTILKMHLDGLPEILLAVAHLPSQRNYSRHGLNQAATSWAGKIREIENDVGHMRTVFVGDLNLNPFDDGIVGGHGFHAVMTRSKALEEVRDVNGEPSPFFYNPMWGFFGDRTPGPPGTYYHSSTDPINYFWNIYDQVLVRPGLIELLHDLSILDHDGSESLLTANGMPARANCSDHLPLLFRLTRKREQSDG
jgi:hypothetical protein